VSTNPNETAFPSSYPTLDPRNEGWIGGGLTKREHFAAMAMQGLLSDGIQSRNAALLAVVAADNLIAELNAKPPSSDSAAQP
jgi:hypothetical protein